MRMLRLYEELALLALTERLGKFVCAYCDQALAGGVLAELLLAGRITIEPNKKQFVSVADATPLGDVLLDEALDKMVTARRRWSAGQWITRLAGDSRLKHR